MKKIYFTPTVELEELAVEQGIATSMVYGESGYAGQDGTYDDYDYEL